MYVYIHIYIYMYVYSYLYIYIYSFRAVFTSQERWRYHCDIPGGKITKHIVQNSILRHINCEMNLDVEIIFS